MSNEPPDNVIQFRDGVVPPVRTKSGSRRPNVCRHRSVLVDHKKRELECSTCGATVDVWEWIDHLARAGDDLGATRREVKRQREILADMDMDERRAKARLRNARKKLPATTAAVRAMRTCVEYLRGQDARYYKAAAKLVAAVDAADEDT